MPNTKRVEYFGTVYKGKLLSVTWANPLHLLNENQIELSQEEYQLIRNVRRYEGDVVASAQNILDNIKKKIEEI